MNNVYAFVVGIEQYDQPQWDIAGPCANALAITEWLLSINVPGENISLFISIKKSSENQIPSNQASKDQENPIEWYKERGVKVKDSRHDVIDTAWRNLPKDRNAGSKLFVYWSGHGYVDKDRTRRFICSDYDVKHHPNKVISATKLLNWMYSDVFSCFAESMLIADVCANYAGRDIKLDPDTSSTGEPIPRAIKPFAWYASQEGCYALGKNGKGEFTEIVQRILENISAWPSQIEFEEALCKECRQAGVKPFQISSDTSDRQSLPFVNDWKCDQVFSLLSGIALSAVVFRYHYRRTVIDLGNLKLYQAQGLIGMIRELGSLCGPEPDDGLLQFLVRLTEEKELQAPVSAWLDEHFSPQRLETMRTKLQLEKQHKILLVELKFDDGKRKGTMETYLRMQNMMPVNEFERFSEKITGWNDFQAKILQLLKQFESKHEQIQQIQFIVDPSYIDWPFHSITIDDGLDGSTHTSLGEHFQVVVRDRKRLRTCSAVINKRWNDYAEALRGLKPLDIKPVGIPVSGDIPDEFERGLCYARFAIPSNTETLMTSNLVEKKRLMQLINLGVSYIYWSYQTPINDDWLPIEKFWSDCLGKIKILDHIPEVFSRRRTANRQLATQATLLWDDPQFHPFLNLRGVEIK